MKARRPGSGTPQWWEAEAGKVHKVLMDYVRTVERRQTDYFDRFLMYEAHYDPNGPAAEMGGDSYIRRLRGIKENVVAISVDTVRASIAATEIRARFMTDGGDWSTQRRAKLLEQYAEEIGKLTKLNEACEDGFFSCAKKGVGLNKVYVDQDRQLRVEPTQVDNIIVDDRECANGASPRQLHFRQADFDCDALIQQFPEHEAEILRARGNTPTGWRRPYIGPGETRNDVLVVESWRLPMGVEDSDRYVPGRHVICVEGADLLDEEWHKPRFPFAVIRYFKRNGSWYGGSLIERNIGHQRVLDRRRHQQDRQLDLSVPTMFVSHIDAGLRVQQTQAGNVIAIKGDRPTTVVPIAVGSEIMNQINDARASAIAEIGLNEMATRGVKQPGLQSGVALREAQQQGSQRFSMQEKAYERFVLDTYELVLDACKDLGDDAPTMSRMTRFGAERIPWGKVEIDDVRVMIAAASPANRTPAGRVQTVLELAQAGIFSQDEALRLIDHPDVKATSSLYTASLEAIEHDLEMIEDGYAVTPEPFVNLSMALRYAQNRYLIDREAGAPEAVLEGLRAYAVQAADVLSMPQSDPAGAMGPGASPLPDGDLAAVPGAPMATPQQVPSSAPPTLPAGTGPLAA